MVALTSRDGIAVQGTAGLGRPGDRLGYQPSLEGLRGLAVLLVLAVHLGENGIIRGRRNERGIGWWVQQIGRGQRAGVQILTR